MKIYKKDDKTAYVGHGTAVLSYGTVMNPTEDMLVNDGWTYSGEGYDPKEYAELVSKYIRQRYTADDEFALINNYLLDQEEYQDAYDEYQAYRAECKKKAKEQLGITSEEG